MKIAYVSDLHSDITPASGSLTGHLREAVEVLSPNVFALVGDLANDLSGWCMALDVFQPLRCEKLVVPGNHDVWIESKNAIRRRRDSWWKHDVALGAAAEQRGFRYLPGRPEVLRGVAFVGSLGWYDYSLRDPRLADVFTTHDYDHGEFLDPRYHRGIWNDASSAVWLRDPDSSDWHARRARLPTREVFERLLALLKADIQSVLPGAGCMVALVHTNPFAQCLRRKDKPDPFDAYEGSDRIGSLLAEYAAEIPVYCLCGHRHEGLDMLLDGVRVLRSPVGYLETSTGDYRELAACVVGELVIDDTGG